MKRALLLLLLTITPEASARPREVVRMMGGKVYATTVGQGSKVYALGKPNDSNYVVVTSPSFVSGGGSIASSFSFTRVGKEVVMVARSWSGTTTGTSSSLTTSTVVVPADMIPAEARDFPAAFRHGGTTYSVASGRPDNAGIVSVLTDGTVRFQVQQTILAAGAVELTFSVVGRWTVP
jgi:hypothetical protein